MIDGVVDAEEAVVDLVEWLDIDGLVLGVVLGKVERELLLYLLGIDGGRNPIASFVEHRQHSVVHIVVEQHDAFLGRAYKVGDEGVGVEDLSVEEDALRWLLASIETTEHLVDALVSVGLMCSQLQLMMLNHLKSLEYLCIGGKKMTHGCECPHNLDIHIDSRL